MLINSINLNTFDYRVGSYFYVVIIEYLISYRFRELGHIPEKDLLRDNTCTKSICAFLVGLASELPSFLLTNISLLLGRIEEEVTKLKLS